jgi:hypothetical protein
MAAKDANTENRRSHDPLFMSSSGCTGSADLGGFSMVENDNYYVSMI